MAKKSLSDLYSYSLFIFDLDNTIYNEEDYLLQAYRAIAEEFERIVPSKGKNKLFSILRDLYMEQGREKLFDKFLDAIDLDRSYIPKCLTILRSFEPAKTNEIDKTIKKVLSDLINQDKSVFVLTNGNVDQQKTKIKYIDWTGLDESIHFVFANEFEPKPSPAGVEYILKISGIPKNETIMIGDSETDSMCARNSGIAFLRVQDLTKNIIKIILPVAFL
ncbi:MAG: HAD-IA family hydrolase [Bacteroidales bacterium]